MSENPVLCAVGDNDHVLITATLDEADGGTPAGPSFALFDDDGTAVATPAGGVDASGPHRVIVDSARLVQPALAVAGIRVRHAHDIALVERILLGRAGEAGAPERALAVLARSRGLPAPPDPDDDAEAGAAARGDPSQLGLFDRSPAKPTAVAHHADLIAAYLDQRRRIDDSATGDRVRTAGIAVTAGALRLLLAAESGSALVAAEMTLRGLPWDADEHLRILERMLGPRPPEGARPARLAALAAEITGAFGFAVNPDSPLDVREALRRAGFDVESTSAHVLRGLDHPAVPLLLEYKDLARLWTANGWHWLDEWVSPDGRLRAQFLPGAVVSGRWATRGGGGLQLPAQVRSAAVAKAGHVFVVADAAQLEPRILAAVSGDAALTSLARGDDLYSALAADGFGGDRRHAKLAMLGAMYGQTSGEAARLMATMRVRYPAAVGFVETAAERGETAGVVRSVLGRACPPPSDSWRRVVGGGADSARRVARDRGRFTRNFVIQASAADWAAVWMTTLRLRLLDQVPAAEIVLFQHDEIVVHAPEPAAEEVSRVVMEAAHTATELVFPGSPVRIPVRPAVVRRYSDAK